MSCSAAKKAMGMKSEVADKKKKDGKKETKHEREHAKKK